MGTAPSIKGELVYAKTDNVGSYKTASIIEPVFGGLKTKGNNGINWTQGQLIGSYSGESYQAAGYKWYKVEYVVYNRGRFLGIGNKYSLKPGGSAWNPKVYSSWFRGDQISAEEVATAAEKAQAAKDKKVADQKKFIEDVMKASETPPPANKGLFASFFGPKIAEDGTVTNNNLGAAVGVLVILIISIIGLVFLRKKQAKAAPQPLTIVQKNGKNYIVNPQTLK